MARVNVDEPTVGLNYEIRSPSRRSHQSNTFPNLINDIVKDFPRNARGAIYAEDLAIWCYKAYAITAS